MLLAIPFQDSSKRKTTSAKLLLHQTPLASWTSGKEYNRRRQSGVTLNRARGVLKKHKYWAWKVCPLCLAIIRLWSRSKVRSWSSLVKKERLQVTLLSLETVSFLFGYLFRFLRCCRTIEFSGGGPSSRLTLEPGKQNRSPLHPIFLSLYIHTAAAATTTTYWDN